MSNAGRPAKPAAVGEMVRMDPRYAAKARALAIDQGVAIGEYILGVAGPTIHRDYLEMLRRLEDAATE